MESGEKSFIKRKVKKHSHKTINKNFQQQKEWGNLIPDTNYTFSALNSPESI